jgi:hypothetical protein
MDYLVFDIESYGFTSQVKKCSFYDGFDYYLYDSVKDMIAGMIIYVNERKLKNMRIYAHNFGKFDGKFLLEYFLKSEFKKCFKISCIISGAIYIKLYVGKGKKRIILDFWDSLKLMPMSLNDLGQDFGYIKGKYEDYLEHKDTEKLEEYLKQDVYVLYNIIKDFYSMLNKICLELGLEIDITKYKTNAGISFGILGQTRYKGKKLEDLTKNYMSKELEKRIRVAYFGGRTEVFTRKVENCNYYDVNSLYPAVMHDEEYPYGKFIEVDNPIMVDRCLKQGYLGVIRCKILKSNCEKEGYYYLPFRTKTDLMFSDLENVEGMWSSIEIQKAIEIGYKIEYISGIFWNQKGKLFNDFVNKFYEIKEKASKEKNKSLRYLSKLILNSAYGKYAQKREITNVVNETDAIKKNLKFVDMSYITGDLFQYTKESFANRKINPIYAIFVAAYARTKLYNYMKVVNFNVAYCDTDSIITPEVMPTSNDLGAMKLEDYVVKGYFVAPKLYGYVNNEGEEVIKAKGMMKKKDKRVEGITFNDIMQVVEYDKEMEKDAYRLLGFFEQSKRIAYKEKDSYITEIKVRKVIKSNENKRTIKDKYFTKSKKISDKVAIGL